MHKKDYISIAKAIRNNNFPIKWGGARKVIRKVIDFDDFVDCLIDIFEEDNPLFDRDKFIEACGCERSTK